MGECGNDLSLVNFSGEQNWLPEFVTRATSSIDTLQSMQSMPTIKRYCCRVGFVS